MTTPTANPKRIAVVLCGSGYKDGSEIREAVAVLWALSMHGVQAQCFAPDAAQTDVVNCLTGKVAAKEKRNMLVEAARIARGAILPLDQLKAEEFDAVVLPGGFGAAKNLCDFAMNGTNGAVRPELQAALAAFRAQDKPIGAVCIAPALVALAFRGEGFDLTVGAEGGAAQAVVALGHRHTVTRPDQALVDRAHKVVTTPAYMYDDASLHEVFEGIRKAVSAVVALA
ncbi:MAG: isoprenoid biosynthesis glyoxalase ElbB [Deltaproteobacteria bacterium]|nr:isoprenoid biosynthesis glyoxalase ElbB [Deltaproteobacteria bacterium]